MVVGNLLKAKRWASRTSSILSNPLEMYASKLICLFYWYQQVLFCFSFPDSWCQGRKNQHGESSISTHALTVNPYIWLYLQVPLLLDRAALPLQRVNILCYNNISSMQAGWAFSYFFFDQENLNENKCCTNTSSILDDDRLTQPAPPKRHDSTCVNTYLQELITYQTDNYNW